MIPFRYTNFYNYIYVSVNLDFVGRGVSCKAYLGIIDWDLQNGNFIRFKDFYFYYYYAIYYCYAFFCYSGGLSNYLYHVKLQKANAEPNQVLLRFYGQTHGEHALESLITDSVIFTLLSERKLGPRLHGIFPGGRIEEYIPVS